MQVKNPRARKQGLEVSLFRRLSEAHPDSMVYLRHQYRMNADIMAISNRLVYDNTLICGSADLADRSMAVKPLEAGWDSLCSGCLNGPQACWVRDILDPR
jgi:DNA replication ATP-dependent helicase Dna2